MSQLTKEDAELRRKLVVEYYTDPDGDTFLNKAGSLRKAGYAETSKWAGLPSTVHEEILDRMRLVLVEKGPKAMAALFQILDNPTEEGNQVKLAAAKEILDRTGITKVERNEKPKIQTNIFVLPTKEPVDVDNMIDITPEEVTTE